MRKLLARCLFLLLAATMASCNIKITGFTRPTIETNVTGTAAYLATQGSKTSSLAAQTNTTTSASAYTSTATPAYTLEVIPTATPWLFESFDEPINLNIWDPNYYCYPQKWTKHHGYINMQLPTMESDQKDYQECLFDLIFSDIKISRVRIVVQILDGYSEASYVGILSSCGEEFKERLGFGIGSAIFHPQSETSTPFYREPVSRPTQIRTLELSWDTGNHILIASLYDFENEVLLSTTQIPCSEYPGFVKFGVYTIQGLSVQAVINQIEIWN